MGKTIFSRIRKQIEKSFGKDYQSLEKHCPKEFLRDNDEISNDFIKEKLESFNLNFSKIQELLKEKEVSSFVFEGELFEGLKNFIKKHVNEHIIDYFYEYKVDNSNLKNEIEKLLERKNLFGFILDTIIIKDEIEKLKLNIGLEFKKGKQVSFLLSHQIIIDISDKHNIQVKFEKRNKKEIEQLYDNFIYLTEINKK
jgi:hypothetical protein